MLPGLTVVAVLVTASPSWLVVPVSDETPSLDGAVAIALALEKTGRTVMVAPAGHPALGCARLEVKQQATCFVTIGATLNLLLVSGVAIRDRVAMTGTLLGRNGEVVEEAGDKGALRDLSDIATSVLSKLAPRLAEIESRPAEPAAIVTPIEPAVEAAQTSRVLPGVGFGVAGASAIAAVVLGVLGSGQAQRVNMLMPGQVAYSQALSMQQEANGLLTGALITGLGALAFGIISAVLWLAAP